MILDSFNLSGKVALVTGSNKGIGQYYALALAEAGADVIGVSFESDFTETEKLITGLGRKFKYYVSNFSDRKDLISLSKKLNLIFPKSIFWLTMPERL